MMKRTIMVLATTLAACGGVEDEPAMQIGFKQHALTCEVVGMQAQLQVSGVDGVCLLTVNADRTVSGTCNGVPAGEIRDFRLLYYLPIVNREPIELATVTARLDLRGETRSKVRVEFPADRVTTIFDADADGRTNIEEYCAGTNPLDRNE